MASRIFVGNVDTNVTKWVACLHFVFCEKSEAVREWLTQLGCRAVGPIQILRAPHGQWQGPFCTLFVTIDEEDVLEGNMELMRQDSWNPRLCVDKD